MADRVYNAPTVVGQFMRDDDPFRIIMGPFGSGKSVGCVMEIIRRCKDQKIGPDGFRRSRWAVVRNTNPQLKDTTLKTWFDWVPAGPAGRWKETEKTFFLEFGDVKAEILFRPLDSPEDIQRVLSLELTGVWLNESREIVKEIVEALQGRIGRYPSQANGGSNWFGMIADTNPPEVDSYWYRLIEHEPVIDDDLSTIMPCSSYKQPSGLLPHADNKENLVEGYYEKLAIGKSPEWVDAYVKGLYLPSQAGKPIYQGKFKQDRHVSPRPLPIHPYLPIVVGMDFGLTPAAVFKQMQPDGRVYTIRAIAAFDMGIKRFITRHLNPTIKTVFPTNPIVIIGDPSGSKRSDSDEGTCFKELKKAGFTAKPARTNDPIVRIQATENVLTSYPDGEPMELFDPSCKFLIEALRSKYRYPRKRVAGGGEQYHDKPEKNKWSHIAEANQYADVFLHGGKYDPTDYTVVSNGRFHQRHTGPACSYTGY